MKRFLFVMAAVAVASAAFVGLTLPPPRRTLAAFPDGTIPGALHVHTNRSDGQGTPDEIAAAAARAGLKFVVFTDHGDATRAPDPPAYRSGVLCLDGVEISTSGGHYAVIDMPAAPYPLGGEARDVVEDVQRLGGFGIAAHPDSPKADLRWREWTRPFDGVELLNLDTGWRILAGERGAAPKWRLFEALVDYPFRSPEVIASLIQPSGALANWESLTQRRRVVTLAGVDAHARLELGMDRLVLPVPSYESAFRVVSVHVEPDRPLSGDAAADAAGVIHAIRAGHVFTAIDAVASPPAFEFTATNTRGTAHEGDELEVGGPTLLRIRSNAPPDFTTIVRDGIKMLASNRDTSDLTVHAPDGPGVYWVEIVAPGARPATWIRSNPIYVRAAETPAGPFERAAASSTRLIFDGTDAGWRIEHDPTSLAALDVGRRVNGTELRVRYGLDGASAAGRFAGVSYATPAGIAAFDRLTLTARADQPMRVSVQLRTEAGERWRRSMYVDTSSQERTVYFDDLSPAGVTPTFRPPLERVRHVLLIIDTVNTKPGSSGRLWIEGASLRGRG